MIAAYIRVSTQKQVNEGVSIEMQKMQIIKHLKLIELIGIEEDIMFFIDEGISASSLSRPAMTHLIEDVKKKEIHMIVAYDLSRISRDIFDTNVFFKLIEKHGVILKFLHDDINLTTAGNRFSANVKVAVNQFEREKIIERTNDGLQAIVDSGRYPCGGMVLYGYKKGGDKNLLVNIDEAAIVIKVFELAIQGYTPSQIAMRINEVQENKLFSTSNIHNMLRNKKYSGVFKYKGQIYKNIIPPIITEEHQEKAIKMCRKNNYKRCDKYMFDGLLYCNHCERRLICVHSVGKKGKKYYYYRCSNCEVSIGQIQLLLQMDSIKTVGIDGGLIKELKARNASIKSRLRTIEDNYIARYYNEEQFLKLTNLLEKELLKIEKHMWSIEKEKEELKCRDRKTYYRSFVSKIIVDLNLKKVINTILIEL